MPADRLEARERVRSCTACELSQKNPPVPFSGPVPAFIAVLGEGPGVVETKRGEPFIGPAGELLRATLREAGLDPDELAYCNATQCFPGAGKNPLVRHLKACAPIMELQLALLAPKYLLCLGASALMAIRPGVGLRRVRGSPFLWDDVIVVAGYHPAAPLHNSLMMGPFREDIQRFVDIIDAGPEWFTFIRDNCSQCPDIAYSYDPTGIPFCKRHEPAPEPKTPTLPVLPDVITAQPLWEENNYAASARLGL